MSEYSNQIKLPPAAQTKLKKVSIWNFIYAILAGAFGALAEFAPEIFMLLFAFLPDSLIAFLPAEYIGKALMALSVYFAGRSKAKSEDSKIAKE